MLSVKVEDVVEFRNELLAKKMPEKSGIRIGQVTQQSYGKEVNIIDVTGACWHFIE